MEGMAREKEHGVIKGCLSGQSQEGGVASHLYLMQANPEKKEDALPRPAFGRSCLWLRLLMPKSAYVASARFPFPH